MPRLAGTTEGARLPATVAETVKPAAARASRRRRIVPGELRIVARVLLVLLTPLVAVALLLALALFTSPGRQALVGLAERLSPAFGVPVTIGGFSDEGLGALRFADVTVGDEGGAWLAVDSLALDWRPAALLDFEVSVDRLALGPTRVARLPQSAPSEEPATSPLPLPVAIDVRRLEIAGVTLDAAVAGEALTIAAAGAAAVPTSTDEPIRISLDATLDGRVPASAAIALDFRPSDDHLAASLDATAPAGGVLHRLAGLPADQPLAVRYRGAGPLADWEGTLDVALGPTPLARGTTRIEQVATGHRITTGLYLTIAELLPAQFAPLAGDAVQVAFVVVAEPGGAIAIETASLAAAAASLTAHGRLDPAADTIEVTTAVDFAASPVFASLLQTPATWTGGHANAHLTGRLLDPDVALEAAVDGVAADRLTAGRVTIAATVAAPVDGTLGVGARDRTATFDIATQSVGIDGAPVASEAAPRATGTATLLPDGGVRLSDVRLDALGAALALDGSIADGAAKADARLRVVDLLAFSPFAGQPLTGAVDLSGRIDAALDGTRATLVLDGGATGFTAGVPELEALIGTTPTVAASVAYDGRTLVIDRLHVAGGVVTADGKGSIGGGDDTLTLDLAVSDLARVTPTLAGAATLTATVTGDPLAPNVAFRLAGDGLVAAGHRLDGFTASGDVDLTKPGAQSGTVTLAGSSAGRPIAGTLQFARDANGERLDIERLAFVGLSGSGTVARGADGVPTGSLSVTATDLAPVAALVGLTASGGLEATVEMPAGQPGTARINLASRRLTAQGTTVSALSVRGTVAGLPAAPRLDLSADVGEVVTAGTALSAARATVSGSLADANVTADARVNGLAVSAAARVQRRADGAIDVALSRATAAGNGAEIALSRPATVGVGADGRVRVDAALAARGGSVTVTGDVSARALSLQVRLQAVPLVLARLAAAELPVGGTVSGSATITGTPAAPRGSYDLTFAGLTSPQAAGLPPATASVRGAVEPTRVTVNGSATAGSATRLEFSGAVPLGAGALSLTARGNADLELIELFGLPPTMDIRGRATLDARIAGTTAAPDVSGTVRISGASFADIENDIRLEGLAGDIRLDRRTARIGTMTGRFADGGTLSVTGSIGLDAAAGFPGDLTVTTDRAAIRNEPIARGIVNARVTLTGPLARAPVIGGTIRLDRVEVTIPDRLPASATTIPVTHTNVPPSQRAFFPQPKPVGADGRRGGPPPFDARLDLTVTAVNQIVVRGAGITADFGGNFRITGTTRSPQVNGGLTLRRGIVDIIGQRLTITSGSISFADTLDPILDLQATTRAGSYTAVVSISGRASRPDIRFSSVPALPEDEVLSVMLFRQLSSGLSATQAIALADAVASLTGSRSGGLLAGLRSRLGVDRLGVVTDANNRPAIEIGGYATDNVYVGVQQGSSAGSTKMQVQVDVTDNLNVQGQVGSDGSSAVGFGVEVDY